ncbi:MAG: hypothetical protein MUC56_07260 [Thermoanaerobaculales bacterium]|jgi:biopolymer transport protein ExbD|nr:hypothetical protein [Thermoanaerobaculales bacterium]
MDLRKRLSTKDADQSSDARGKPWNTWLLLGGLVVFLSIPFLVGLKLPGTVNYGNRYRPATAVTGKRVPDLAAIISIDRQETFRVSNGEEVAIPVHTERELHEAIEGIVRSFPDRPFLLKIDRDTPYDHVDIVIKALRAADVKNIYFHTEPIPQS